ncbi:MAG TPA: antibiotic biosynthesis monooxygenase, partial [Candidatus Saccharimonadia bacterium]|nr:antibiotic biosynthesis monooxygenase [Candidatus Saccharimonadia bacterium]
SMEEAVHVAITRRVREEHVSAFEKALAEFARDSLAAPGTRGVQFIYPAPGSGSLEYGILRTFSDQTAREAFYESPLYLQWQERVRHMVEGDPTCRDLHGLEAWFRDPGGGHPPRWKMALVTWSAVWPVSMLIPALFLPVIGFLPHVLRAGIISAGITATLTWVAMPLLVKAAHRWLHP